VTMGEPDIKYQIVPRYSLGEVELVDADMAHRVAAVEFQGYAMYLNGECGHVGQEFAKLVGVSGIVYRLSPKSDQIEIHDVMLGNSMVFSTPEALASWETRQRALRAVNYG
jgi:hypothetical protein